MVTLRLSDNDLVFVISEIFSFHLLPSSWSVQFTILGSFIHLLFVSSIMTYFIHFSLSFIFPIQLNDNSRFFCLPSSYCCLVANVLALPRNGFTIQWIAFYSTSNSLLFSPKRSVNAFLIFLFFFIHRTHHFSSPFHINAAHFCIVKFSGNLCSIFFSFRLVLSFFFPFFYLLPFSPSS